MIDIIEPIEAKWGKMNQDGHALVNGNMPFISEEARLNMLFPTSNFNNIISNIHSKYNCQLPDQIREFYQVYNGCRLFFGSLNVFGIQSHLAELYQPYDIFVENNHILGSLKTAEKSNCKILFIASIGGDYAYGFDIEKPGKIVGIKKGKLQIVQNFPDFNSFFNFHFNRLIEEYDENCKKKHPSKQFHGIPVLENVSTEIV